MQKFIFCRRACQLLRFFVTGRDLWHGRRRPEGERDDGRYASWQMRSRFGRRIFQGEYFCNIHKISRYQPLSELCFALSYRKPANYCSFDAIVAGNVCPWTITGSSWLGYTTNGVADIEIEHRSQNKKWYVDNLKKSWYIERWMKFVGHSAWLEFNVFWNKSGLQRIFRAVSRIYRTTYVCYLL